MIITMPKAKKELLPVPAAPVCRETLGLSPSVLANRYYTKLSPWCPNPSNIEYDRYSDPNEPKIIGYNQIHQAYQVIKKNFPITPLMKTRCRKKFNMDLYFKLETVHTTGSFHERSALYVLQMLSKEQRKDGVYTASAGNWAMALAYYAQKMRIAVTVVLPEGTSLSYVNKCKNYGAKVVLFGKIVAESKRRAFTIISENDRKGTYINGYDHPHVISGAGSIGFEIISQLPDVDVILVPIGGGGLIAGVAVAVKHKKPNIKIYGVEPLQGCHFFEAMGNDRPHTTPKSLAMSLSVPQAGDNAFHTVRSLIDKMVLVDDDWIARAILHLVEEEKLVVEGAGAISLGALLSMPDILPELRGKKVVCILSGGNIDNLPLTRILARGKSVEGRLILIKLHLKIHEELKQVKIFKVIEKLRCTIRQFQIERDWLGENKLLSNYITILCETQNLQHALTLKKVLDKLIPGACQFQDDNLNGRRICSCFPKKMML